MSPVILLPRKSYWTVGLITILGVLSGATIACGVGISNDGGNKLGTFNACNTGADTFTVGAATGSLYTSFGLIDASTFITVKGSCFGAVLAIPYPKPNPPLDVVEAEYGLIDVGNNP